MKKQKLFNALDLVILFNIFLFIFAGISTIGNNNFMSFAMILIGVINIIYYVLTIILRYNYNKIYLSKIEFEIEMDKEIQDKSSVDINRIKQEALENLIKVTIEKIYPEAKIIQNAYIPRRDGQYSEIDLIAIMNKGIYIFESKNIVGNIIGHWDQENLTISHPSGETYNFYNPIKQNSNHFQNLKNILNFKNDYFRNIVVVGERAFIESLKNVPPYAQVTHLVNLDKAINRLYYKNKINLQPHQIDSIYNTLIKFVTKNEFKEMVHVNNINKLTK